jgi:hypothetical protein
VLARRFCLRAVVIASRRDCLNGVCIQSCLGAWCTHAWMKASLRGGVHGYRRACMLAFKRAFM